MAANPQPRPEDQYEAQRAQTEHSTGMSVAAEQARQQGLDPGDLQSQEFVDSVTDPDVDRDLPDDDSKQHNIETLLGGEFSKQLALGNLSPSELSKEALYDDARRKLLKMQFSRPQGSGRECTGRIRHRMTGGQADAAVSLSPDLESQIDAGYEAKRMMRSGSKRGGLIKRILETHAVTRSEQPDFDDGSRGYLNRLTGGILGG